MDGTRCVQRPHIMTSWEHTHGLWKTICGERPELALQLFTDRRAQEKKQRKHHFKADFQLLLHFA